MSLVQDKRLAGLIDEIISCGDLRSVLVKAAEGLGSTLDASRVVCMLYSPDGRVSRPPVEWSVEHSNSKDDSILLKLAKFIQDNTLYSEQVLEVSNAQLNPICYGVRAIVNQLDIRSILAISTYYKSSPNGTIIIYQSGRVRRWSEEEISVANLVAYYVGISIHHHTTAQTGRRVGVSYHRLVEHTEAVFFSLDKEFFLSSASTKARRCFGLPEGALPDRLALVDLIYPSDKQIASDAIPSKGDELDYFDLEFRVTNRLTGDIFWLQIRMVPRIDSQGALDGWDAFGVDVTSRMEVQLSLQKQQESVSALYSVAKAVSGTFEPQELAESGLRVLCEKAKIDAALISLKSGDEGHKAISFCSIGLAPGVKKKLDSQVCLGTRIADAISIGQAVVIPSFLEEESAQCRELAEQGLQSAVIVPIGTQEGDIFGSLALFSQVTARFDENDVMLFRLAAIQIGSAIKQAELFSAYRKQTKQLESLYRISHELSTNVVFEDVIKRAFTIIKDELGLKRLWLGLLDELGSRIIGQAAYGSGWKRRLVEANIDISEDGHPFRKIVVSREPVVLENPGDLFSSLDLKRISSRLGSEPAVFVPLVVRGEVLGILAVQPEDGKRSLGDEEMSLLTSLATEMGTVILTRRLEKKIAEGEKMRTAGLLASGIAHNFNNILQAIMGQASLLELQRSDGDAVSKAVKLINSSAARGAVLVRKLLSFTDQQSNERSACSINELLTRNRESLFAMLSSKHKLVYQLSEGLPDANVSSVHVLQIISGLVANSADAMPDGGSIEIITDEHQGFTAGNESVWPGAERERFVRVIVRDTGIGMTEDEISHCFEPFYTTKDIDQRTGLSMTGAGLGLAVAYALARRNGGALVAESVSGWGSVFTLYLPVAEVNFNMSRSKQATNLFAVAASNGTARN